MSAKIYYGFKINTDSFQEALQIVNSFRPWVEKQAEDLLNKFIENSQAAYKGEEKNPTDIKIACFDLWQDMRRKVIREKGFKVPHIDTDFNVVLIPTNGFVLGIVYTSHNDWYNAWCNHPGVEEYSYWNNTDEPEGMSEEEWNKREEDWKVLDYTPVAMQGFSIDLVDPNGPFPEFLRMK
jgi:hypothetical protein